MNTGYMVRDGSWHSNTDSDINLDYCSNRLGQRGNKLKKPSVMPTLQSFQNEKI